MRMKFMAFMALFGLLVSTPSYASEDLVKDGWELISEDEGFVTHRKEVKESNIFAFRGEMIADLPISMVMSIFLDSARRNLWVDRFHSSKDIVRSGEFDKTYWIRFGLPFPISDRDYVLQATGNMDNENRVFTAHIRSVENENRPEDDCCVRASAMGTYYRFKAIPGENKTKLEVEVHTDPKGLLPGWLVNLIQKNWPRKTLTGLVREAQNAQEAHRKFVSWQIPPAATEPKTNDVTAAATADADKAAPAAEKAAETAKPAAPGAPAAEEKANN
ncbi:MAG: START domain-containing protein [Myxococcota bacterium]|nr:START domain-containing protein [Myxococcota bacterium]